MTELFPHTDKLGESMTIDGADIVAFDLNGERYCVECAKAHSDIDTERFHRKPRTVPYGGSVLRQHMREVDHKYHCGNSECGKEIPGQQVTRQE